MSNCNTESLGIHHDPGPTGVTGGLSGNATDVINQLSGVSKNGMIVNALLVWMDIQMRTTPENC